MKINAEFFTLGTTSESLGVAFGSLVQTGQSQSHLNPAVPCWKQTDPSTQGLKVNHIYFLSLLAFFYI